MKKTREERSKEERRTIEVAASTLKKLEAIAYPPPIEDIEEVILRLYEYWKKHNKDRPLWDTADDLTRGLFSD